MDDKTQELYHKYMAFHSVMLENHKPLELAAVLLVQALSFYRTVMTEEDYLTMVDSIYENRHEVKTFTGPYLQ